MIVVLLDDSLLYAYPSIDAVVVDVEALDTDCLRAVYDEKGCRYRVDWIEPNRRSWLGVSNGRYRLVPDGAPDPDGLLSLIRSNEVAPDATEAVRALEQNLRRKP